MNDLISDLTITRVLTKTEQYRPKVLLEKPSVFAICSNQDRLTLTEANAAGELIEVKLSPGLCARIARIAAEHGWQEN